MESSKEQIASEQSDLKSEDLGSLWSYKGKTYQIALLVKVKDPHDSNWYQGVMYKPLDNSGGLCYVRYETDFLRKFRRVPKGEE